MRKPMKQTPKSCDKRIHAQNVFTQEISIGRLFALLAKTPPFEQHHTYLCATFSSRNAIFVAPPHKNRLLPLGRKIAA